MSTSKPVTVLIEIHANEGQEAQARDALLHAIKTSEKPGLVSSRQYADLNDPGAFFAVQEWESTEAFRAHMKDAAEGGMNDAIRVLRTSPRTTVLQTIG
ncbi:putative quinol monooxygenase [Cryptosporangium sp. NPDC051539]|uniref:putative quinol monooxygenase n=1 Tax=Cryptosporangium sp. NPDC051539 TaxID=3363962 RepID=UPI00379FF3C9